MALAKLDMKAKTMMFRGADAALINAAKAGDMVRFAVERRDGLLTVTAIEPTP